MADRLSRWHSTARARTAVVLLRVQAGTRTHVRCLGRVRASNTCNIHCGGHICVSRGARCRVAGHVANPAVMCSSQHGHAGSSVFQRLAERLCRLAMETCNISRYGRRDFVSVQRSGAGRIADCLAAALAATTRIVPCKRLASVPKVCPKVYFWHNDVRAHPKCDFWDVVLAGPIPKADFWDGRGVAADARRSLLGPQLTASCGEPCKRSMLVRRKRTVSERQKWAVPFETRCSDAWWCS